MVWYRDDAHRDYFESRRLAREIRDEQVELSRLKYEKERLEDDVSYPKRITMKKKVRQLLLLVQEDAQYSQLLKLLRSDQLPRPKLRHLMTMVQRAQKHDTLLDFEHQLRLQTLLNSTRRRLPYWEQWSLEDDSDEDEDYRVRVRMVDTPEWGWRRGIESKVNSLESKLPPTPPQPKKAAEWGHPCHYKEDCEGNLICKEGICLDTGTVADDRKAAKSSARKAPPPRKKRHNEHCDEPTDCESGYCEQNRCLSKRKARRKAAMFAACVEGKDCASGNCVEDICV